MVRRPHYWLDILVFLLTVAIALYLFWRARKLSPRARLGVWGVLTGALGICSLGLLFVTVRVNRLFPADFVAWVRCVALFTSGSLLYAALLTMANRFVRFVPQRRALLGAAIAAPVAAATVGVLRRDDLTIREVSIKLPKHAAALDGVRILQLTDIHLSTFVSENYLARAVAMGNELRPHIALVTGDLVTTKGDPLDACLRQLARLRADAGIYGCCGNHEIYADAEQYVQEEGKLLDIHFLRQESVRLPFTGANIQLAGVDYQRRGFPYLTGADLLRDPDSYNILLTHNPDVFDVAAEQGWDLSIAGHTHGGQVHMEILHPTLNVARFYTPYVYGLFNKGMQQMYVSRGVGTIGIPLRLGAPPEVVCIRLCAT